MQRFPGAAESDTGCSDPELCERCSAECGNEHAAECSRVRQSAAGSAVEQPWCSSRGCSLQQQQQQA